MPDDACLDYTACCVIHGTGKARPQRNRIDNESRRGNIPLLRQASRATTPAAMAVFAAFATGFRSLFWIILEVAATVLAAFAASLGCTFWIILEIAAAVLAAFAARFGCTFRIVLEIAAAILAAFLFTCHFSSPFRSCTNAYDSLSV
jgi:hypothetical protein